MYPKKIARDTAKVLQSYLTYQAVRTIIDQLSETNPTQAIWLSQYSSTNNIQDSEAYLEGLMAENKELVLRIMTVREHLAETVLDFLPEMVRTGISQANMERRRQLLERLTQTQSTTSRPHSESPDSEPNESSDSQP
ncbi:MAG: chaperonin family protein RbcX [Hydrococcus sp. C42_A2020_068]|uniref:RuBisCO chaperone RbcX n=1 Tax=Pleurocapsa sp. PCC 7327 TaxID=118163 RepID=UPI00029FF4CC|nr:chaperonin family protein RbcX [Pleurocapsa sp. PCC 7327]AFY75778.1 RbcX protein [Pleurocapsa sp. PCC 7327]MBF2020445.1 chaperonin family protein RbcX [Hydrococcus sp. C42_A2020_068]